ncbi:TatD family hydrolase [Methanopyrus sp.]
MQAATDVHLHFNPVRGDGYRVFERFHRAGGTGFVSPVLTLKSYRIRGFDRRSFERAFRLHLEGVRFGRLEYPLRGYASLGWHPAEVARLAEREPDRVMEVAETVCDLIERYHAEYDEVVAIGEVGHPHFPVREEVRRACHRVFLRFLELAKDLDLPVIYHGPRASKKHYMRLKEWLEGAGFDPERFVRHRASPDVGLARGVGVWPSVPASRRGVREAAESGDEFLLESDYLDDPTRPNAALPVRAVPKAARLLRLVDEDLVGRVMVENPERVFGVEFEPL